MSQQRVYYFDNNATTRIAPEVIDAMLPYLRDYWGNPSSAYHFGSQVVKAIDQARVKIAGLINADPREVIFTSCGTESNNTAWHSALMTQPNKRHIVTTVVEHSANINYGRFLEKQGYEVTYLPVDGGSLLDLRLLEQSIRPDTALVSIMHANNETGVIFPIEEIAKICHGKSVLCHTDAVQSAGKLKLDVKTLGVDMLSLSAHKFHAPKGIGVLYMKRHTKYQAYVIGGHQERSRRGGTENVAGMVAFGRAAELALDHLREENTHVRALRDRLENTILQTIPHTYLNGAKEPRLPNTTSISFDFIEAEAILMLFDQTGICASSGSACTTGSLDPSHVLKAMGLSNRRARGSVRFSLGMYTTDEEVDYLLEQIPQVVTKLRAISPLNPDHPDNPQPEILLA